MGIMAQVRVQTTCQEWYAELPRNIRTKMTAPAMEGS